MYASELEQLTTPAGELAGYGPEGAGYTEIVGRENACRDNGRNR
jgi:hypothetical protein